MAQKFDAIVVGASPARCACHYKLAQAGLQLLAGGKGKVLPGQGDGTPSLGDNSKHKVYVRCTLVQLCNLCHNVLSVFSQ